MERRLAEAKEARIEHLKKAAMRRIANQGLAKGWGAWVEMWEERCRQRRMLLAAAGRLAKPALTAALAHWRADWAAAREAERQKESLGGSAKLRAEWEEKMRNIRDEKDQLLSLERVALVDARAAAAKAESRAAELEKQTMRARHAEETAKEQFLLADERLQVIVVL